MRGKPLASRESPRAKCDSLATTVDTTTTNESDTTDTDDERHANKLRYNRYLAIAGRAVRRSLKDDKRVAAERRGNMDLRFSKWQVRDLSA